MELMADAFMIGLEKFLSIPAGKYDIKTADESKMMKRPLNYWTE